MDDHFRGPVIADVRRLKFDSVLVELHMTHNPYEPPNAACSAEQPTMAGRNLKEYSPEYNSAFLTAVVLQSSLALITALVLDHGQTHRAFWVAFLCQWATTCIVLFRRPMNPTRTDLLIVRYGIIPMMAIVTSFGPILVRHLGIDP